MTEVLAVHAWRSNAELIADVAMLGYLDGTVLDVTYGRGVFWKRWRPDQLTTSDLRGAADHAWDYKALPVADGAFDVVVFDPDYKLNGTPVLGEMDERYGVDENKSREARLDDIVRGALEAFRVCRRRVLVKCMDQVEGGVMRWQTDLVTVALETAGARKIDRFDILGAGRPQPSNRTKKHTACKGTGCDDCAEGRVASLQATARHNCSQLLVFKKPSARRAAS